MLTGRRIIIKRLASMWNPLEALELAPNQMTLEKVTQGSPISRYKEDGTRGLRYHQGRVHYFIQCLHLGKILEPIFIDNDIIEGGSNMNPLPVVFDGNHRLLAHILLNYTTVQAYYEGGRKDVLRYLQGYRKSVPV